ncbi:MAG: hypothetical protein ABIP38_09115, partial [Steroidobacteraceae bacterium]
MLIVDDLDSASAYADARWFAANRHKIFVNGCGYALRSIARTSAVYRRTTRHGFKDLLLMWRTPGHVEAACLDEGDAHARFIHGAVWQCALRR